MSTPLKIAHPARCPKCGRDSCVIDSREALSFVRRRRACIGKRCNTRWTTIEILSHEGDKRGTHTDSGKTALATLSPDVFEMLHAEFTAFVNQKLRP